MTKLLYCSIHVIADHEVDEYVRLLPASLQYDVVKYKYLSDQKARLLARLMLCSALADTGNAGAMAGWQRDSRDKPFITGWYPFNISHSGDWVMFSYSDTEIGVDIEKNESLAYTDMLNNFHPAEKAFIEKAGNPHDAFYKIWVRKEALLKATGIGISEGLRSFNCVPDHIVFAGKQWFFHPLYIHPGYSGCLCTTRSDNQSIPTWFSPRLDNPVL
jgi:4'-phosphopantetheinyl transferase